MEDRLLLSEEKASMELSVHLILSGSEFFVRSDKGAAVVENSGTNLQ